MTLDDAALVRFAHGMVGSVATAEDLVQEARIRLAETPHVRNPGAWMRTVVSRLALDELKSARVQRTTYPGPWLPEPRFDGDPESDLARSEAVSMATLAVLEACSPAERAAFLLRELFEVDYEEISVLLERKPAAVRQLVRRARAHVAEHRSRYVVDPEEHARVLGAFATAVTTGDLEALQRVLADEVRFVSDGGGKVSAALRPVEGADRVGRLVLGLAKKAPADTVPQFTSMEGQPAMLLFESGRLTSVSIFSIHNGEITAIFAVRNPDKLSRVRDRVRP